MDNDHYSVLGVDEQADGARLRAAYLARMRVHHPDRHPGDPGDRARDINRAYEVLSDPVRRAAYDRSRVARRTTRLPAPGTTHVRSRSTAAPRGARLVTDAAYSDDNQRYYRSVSAGLVRIGAAVFTIGVVLILLLSA